MYLPHMYLSHMYNFSKGFSWSLKLRFSRSPPFPARWWPSSLDFPSARLLWYRWYLWRWLKSISLQPRLQPPRILLLRVTNQGHWLKKMILPLARNPLNEPAGRSLGSAGRRCISPLCDWMKVSIIVAIPPRLLCGTWVCIMPWSNWCSDQTVTAYPSIWNLRRRVRQGVCTLLSKFSTYRRILAH